MMFALLNASHDAVVEYPLSRERMWQIGRTHNLEGAADPTLAALNIVRVESTEKPSTAFGETVAELEPEKYVAGDPGQWRQRWQVDSITLAEAKSRLRDEAIQVYWSKMGGVATADEMTAASGSYIAVLQARETRWNSLLASTRADIQAASTIAEAHAIYVTLRDAA